MTVQTLEQVIGDSGHLGLGITGIVDVALRNDDGSLADHRHSRNAVLENFRKQFGFFSYQNSGGLPFGDNQWIFIHENNQPLNKFNGVYRSMLQGVSTVVIAWTRDGPNRLWSTSAVIASGQPTRTFQTIGVSINTTSAVYGGIQRSIPRIWAATVLSSPITQLNTQSLEITYRFAFSRN